MYTTKTAWWDAKNRFGMPDKLPLTWESLAPIFGSAPAAETAPPVNTPPAQQVIEKAQQAGIPAKAVKEDLSSFVDIPTAPQQPTGYQRVQGIPDALADLMQQHNVTAEQIEYVSIDVRHYMANGMKIQQFPTDYLMYLTTIWDQVVQLIKENCNDYVPY